MKLQNVTALVFYSLLIVVSFVLFGGCDDNITLIQGTWEYQGNGENIDSSLDGFEFNIVFSANTMTISPLVSYADVSNISVSCNYTIQGSNIVTSGGALFCGQSYRFDLQGDVLLIENFVCSVDTGWCIGFEFVREGTIKPKKSVASGNNDLETYDTWEYYVDDSLSENTTIETLIFDFNSSNSTVAIDAALNFDLISYTVEEALTCNYSANSGQVLLEVNDKNTNLNEDCKILSDDIVFDYTINGNIMRIDSMCIESVCITGLRLAGVK